MQQIDRRGSKSAAAIFVCTSGVSPLERRMAPILVAEFARIRAWRLLERRNPCELGYGKTVNRQCMLNRRLSEYD
jgi:hypothetical protein